MSKQTQKQLDALVNKELTIQIGEIIFSTPQPAPSVILHQGKTITPVRLSNRLVFFKTTDGRDVTLSKVVFIEHLNSHNITTPLGD